ncbi:thyroid transcription factor 1-associated protein 26 homolog [Pomacea canaliculata]|uniref:thyroid transcription factor 1-associated protein 26 homolog n=1 Tax=Pomacea canaliculata TaxID=400727 RepID=UPI000D726417|nr:thyroid transcription factor 1-associated protein 26 homolog [Pomacea canaliculata]
METNSKRRSSYKRKFKADDKSRYKYVNGSHTQGQGFADIRKRKILLEYNKVKRKERATSSTSKHMYNEEQSSEDEKQLQKNKGHQSKFQQKKVSRFSNAEWKYQNKCEEKRKKAEEATRKKKEREAALDHYKKKKKERHLKLCKRTNRGQPVLHNHIQILLEKLEKQHKSSAHLQS